MKTLIIILFYCSMAFAQSDIYDLIIQYEQECYADSSFQNIHTTPSDGFCIIDWDCIVESHWSNKWIHREPDWNGFRKFVKKETTKINAVLLGNWADFNTKYEDDWLIIKHPDVTHYIYYPRKWLEQ